MQTCSSIAIPLYTKWGPKRHGMPRLVWKKLCGHNRALTKSPLNLFGMNWNANCMPDLLTQHNSLTLLMLLWLNEHISSNHAPKYSIKPSQIVGAVIASKRKWECNVQQRRIIRCSHTVGHIMYVYSDFRRKLQDLVCISS